MDKLEILNELELLLTTQRRQKTALSFSLFIDIYLKHLTPNKRPTFHSELITLLEKSIEGGGVADPGGGGDINTITPTNFSTKFSKEDANRLNRLLFIAPRGFAKSTICSVFFPLWLAVNGKRKDIFLVSATVSLAKELLRKIRIELEANELFLQDFGQLKSDKWTEDMLVLSNGVCLRAKGRGFQIRGFRPDIIICDDLEDEDSLYSKEQRDKLENWFFRTLLPSLKPHQNLVYVGTKLHQLSLIGKLEVKDEFLLKKFMALTNGQSIWEELFSTVYLKKLKTELGSYAFEAEYQNNPISLEEQPIKPHYLEGVVINDKSDYACLAIDPAISEKQTSDPRAFVLIEKTDSGFREAFSESGHWSISEQIDRIIGIYSRYKDKYKEFRIVIEEVAFQKIFRQELLKESRKRGIYIPVSTAELGVGDNKRPKDKFTRLMQVIHLFEQRLVQVVNPDLRDELLMFPFGDHDDMVDACVYALYWLMNFRKNFASYRKDEKLPIDYKDNVGHIEIKNGVATVVGGRQPVKIRNKSNFINLNK